MNGAPSHEEARRNRDRLWADIESVGGLALRDSRDGGSDRRREVLRLIAEGEAALSRAAAAPDFWTAG